MSGCQGSQGTSDQRANSLHIAQSITPASLNDSSVPIDCNATPSSSPAREELTLGGKRKLTSAVWTHYKRQQIDGNWKAICNYCQKKLGGDTKNGTKHLHDHFNCCPLRKNRSIKQTFLRSSKNDEGTLNVSAYVFDQETARREMASMIILHEYPLAMVEHIGFRRFTSALQPMYKVVSRHTVKRDILKIFEHEKIKMMKLFEKNQSRVAITTDMWTANYKKRGFMAITAHYVDNSWNLQSRLVRFIYVPCPHTAEELSNELVTCLMDWNLDQNLSTLTVDNCSTNDLMMNLILDKVSRESLILDGELVHMRCCAHILNLIVKDGLDVIGDGIDRIRGSVAFWTATPKRDEKFEETARQLKIPFTKKLVLDCKTRWNSTYLILVVAIGYKDVFYRLKQRDPNYKCLPLESDWEVGKEICEKLKLFYNVTELFSGTKYPTSNLFFPKICEIRMALKKWAICGSSIIEEMTDKMVQKFDKYWKVIHGIMGVAVVLDPRYKLRLLNYYFPLLYGDELSNFEIERIRTLCYKLVNQYQSKTKSGQDITDSFTTSSQSSFIDTDEIDPMCQYDQFVASESTIKFVRSELDNYLDEPVIPRTPGFDILAWWKMQVRYPTLQLVARDVLAIPISTVASESAFSTGGRFVSAYRSSLQPNTLEALMCMQDWLWAEGNCSSVFAGSCSNYNDDDIDDEGSSIDEN